MPGRGSLARAEWVGAGLCALLVAATLLVHDVGYLLRQPFWLDEAWVALSTRVPLSDLTQVTSATPTGWTVLLRILPADGEGLRLLPLLFMMASVVAAYLVGRAVFDRPAAGVAAGLLAGTAALLVPSVLIRADLKQYTADAFVALLALALLARVESRWSRGRLALLAGTGVLGMLISHTVVFVVPAALLSLAVVQLVRRDWPRLVEAVVAGLAAAIGMGAVYVGLDRRHVVDSIQDYWAAYYVPWRQGVSPSLRFLRERSETLEGAGLGPVWLCAVLLLAGVVVLFRAGRPALALTIPAIGVATLVAGALRLYPLLDPRTSHFLLTVVAVVAAIGVAGLVVWAAARHVLLGAAIAVLAVVLFAWGGRADWRAQPIPVEDVRSQVRYLEQNLEPTDVVLVDYGASFGFGFYYRGADPQLQASDVVATQFVVAYPAEARVVVMSQRGPAAVTTALAQATALAGSTGRIWIVRAHQDQAERRAWATAVPDATVIDVGPDPLLLVE